jgi:RNA polymerase sigma factor (TIGR02999 family)
MRAVLIDESVKPEGTVTRLLAVARGGDDAAAQELWVFLYQDLRRVARSRLRANTHLTLLDTTALVHESFLRLVHLKQVGVTDRISFFRYAATVMRSIVIDFVRMKKTERRGGDLEFVTLTDDHADSIAQQEDDVIRVSQALDEMAKVDSRAAQVVEMRYFVGMTEPEVALALGVTERTVRRDWDKARLLLKVALS